MKDAKEEADTRMLGAAMQRAAACRQSFVSPDPYEVLRLALELEVAKKRIGDLEAMLAEWRSIVLVPAAGEAGGKP